MPDTFRMWRMMRLLKANQHDWALTAYPELPGETEAERKDRLLKQLLEIAKRKDDAEVLVLQLAVEYQKKYCIEPEKVSLPWVDINGTKKLSGTLEILYSCKHAKLLKFSSDDGTYLRITYKGKKFATPEGLLKAWIVNDIGILGSISITAIASIIGTFGAINWDQLVTVTGFISSWW